MEPEQVQRELIELQRQDLADVLPALGREQAPGDGDARGEGAFHADCETSVAAVDLRGRGSETLLGGKPSDGRGWDRTSDLPRVKRALSR